MMKSWKIWGAVGLLLIGSVGAWFFFRPRRAIEEKPWVDSRVYVETDVVRRGPIAKHMHLSGTLVATQSAILVAEVPGKIISMDSPQGQMVKKGDVLVALDDKGYQALVDQAKARFDLTHSDYRRTKMLFDKGYLSQHNLDKALAEWKITQAELKKATVELQKTKIAAPFDGVVGLHRVAEGVSEGTFVSGREAVVSVTRLNPLYVDFAVPESLSNMVEVGKIVDVTVQGETLPQEAEIMAIEPLADTQTHSVKVRASLDNSDHLLRPGQFAHILLRTHQDQRALLVPNFALEKEGDQNYVYRVHEGRALQVPVDIGLQTETMTQITQGLEEGWVIVTAGQIKIRHGTPVRTNLKDVAS